MKNSKRILRDSDPRGYVRGGEHRWNVFAEDLDRAGFFVVREEDTVSDPVILLKSLEEIAKFRGSNEIANAMKYIARQAIAEYSAPPPTKEGG